jgi:hypothetical protein
MSFKYLTDTQRTELALPAHMLLNVLLAGAEVRAEPRPGLKALTRIGPHRFRTQRRRERYAYRVEAYQSFLKCRDLLMSVNRSVNADLHDKARAKLLRRVEREYFKIVEPFIKDDAKVEKFGLVSFYFLQILVERRWIHFSEDSELQQALDILLPGLNHLARKHRVDLSAQKQARRAFDLMQKQKYYVD